MNHTAPALRGRLICFEGIDGSGKTTQATMLSERLQACGSKVLTVREPGGTRISQAIRDILLDRTHTEMSDRAEALLYFSARAQLVEEAILPAIIEGVNVITDRFGLSTLAYQGYGRGLDLVSLRAINEFSTARITPDLTLVCDIDAQAATARRHQSDDDRIESAGLEFLERTRQGYLKLAEEDELHVIVLDASREQHELHHEICKLISARFPELLPPP